MTTEKKKPIGYLTYLPYREDGNGSRIGPVFGTKRDDCKSLLVESIPMRLVQDIQRGDVGSFFIWDVKPEEKDEGGA
jgi:hypothetical protein